MLDWTCKKGAISVIDLFKAFDLDREQSKFGYFFRKDPFPVMRAKLYSELPSYKSTMDRCRLEPT